MPRLGAIRCRAVVLATLALCAFLATVAGTPEAAWISPVALSGPDRDALSAAVALGADGRMFATWVRSDGSHYRVEAAVRPAGGVLETPQIVSQAGVDASAPKVALDGQGNAILMWNRGSELQWAVRAAGASAFGDLRTVPVPAGESPGQYRLAVSANGAAAVLVQTEDSTMSMTMRLRGFVRPPGGDFTADRIFESFGTNSLNDQYNFSPIDLDADAQGGFYATWNLRHDHFGGSPFTDTAVKVARRPAGAMGFEPTETVVSGHVTTGGSTEGRVAEGRADIGPDGTMYVIYTGRVETSPPQTALVLRSRPADGNFNSNPGEFIVPLEEDGPTDTGFEMNDAGTGAIAWSRGSGVNRAVKGCFRPAGGPCSETRTLATGNVRMPIAAIGAAGDAVAAWERDSGAAQEASFRRAGGAFADLHGVGAGATATLQEAGVDVDPLGHAVIATSHAAGATRVTEAFVEDSVAPTIDPLAAPAGGGQGDALGFGGGVFDVWGPVSAAWDFGDGASGPGPAATHAYALPGTFTATLAATDAAGNVATRSAQLLIGDAVAPTILSFRMTHRTFAVGRRSTPLSARRRAPRGTTFRFRLSERAAARIAIQRKRGRKWRTVGTLKRRAPAGPKRVKFSGRLRRKPLAVGRYRAVLVAVDPAKNKSKPRRLGFRVVRR